jgi:hypothetical protein
MSLIPVLALLAFALAAGAYHLDQPVLAVLFALVGIALFAPLVVDYIRASF